MNGYFDTDIYNSNQRGDDVVFISSHFVQLSVYCSLYRYLDPTLNRLLDIDSLRNSRSNSRIDVSFRSWVRQLEIDSSISKWLCVNGLSSAVELCDYPQLRSGLLIASDAINCSNACLRYQFRRVILVGNNHQSTLPVPAERPSPKLTLTAVNQLRFMRSSFRCRAAKMSFSVIPHPSWSQRVGASHCGMLCCLPYSRYAVTPKMRAWW